MSPGDGDRPPAVPPAQQRPPVPRRDAAWHATASLQALRDVLEVGVRVRRQVRRRTGLSEVELAALEELSRGPRGAVELARAISVSTAAVTGLADRLTARGHLARVPDVSDRRRTQLHATEEARATMATELGPMFEALAELDATFTPAEREVVARYLRGACAALGHAVDEP